MPPIGLGCRAFSGGYGPVDQPGVVPVPSTRNRLHLEMNAAAVGVRLTPGELDRLGGIFPAKRATAIPDRAFFADARVRTAVSVRRRGV